MTHQEVHGGAAARGPTVLTAREVAELIGGRLEGDPDRPLTGISPLEEAASEELGLLTDRRYLPHLEATAAGALLVSSDLASEVGRRERGPQTRIVVDDPHAALPALLRRFHPATPPEPGVHPTAVLEAGVELGEEVTIGPYAVIGAGCSLGDRVRVGAHSVVGHGSSVGDESVLHPHVVLYPGSTLGRRVILHSGVRIGSDGYGYATVDGVHHKIPQVGGCVIDDDVEIGANSTVDRGSIGSTRVGRGAKLDNLVQLGHNVSVGAGSMLVAQVGVAGSTRIGKGVLCGGQAGLIGHVDIGDGARIAGQAGVIGDIGEGETVAGFPARERGAFLRGHALMLKLPELWRRIRELERRIGEVVD